jgi:YbbR domain-containing protein
MRWLKRHGSDLVRATSGSLAIVTTTRAQAALVRSKIGHAFSLAHAADVVALADCAERRWSCVIWDTVLGPETLRTMSPDGLRRAMGSVAACATDAVVAFCGPAWTRATDGAVLDFMREATCIGRLFSCERERAKVVEQRVKDIKPVEVKYRGSSDTGQEPSLIGVDPEEVEVAGVESRVNRVNCVRATVKVSKVGDSESSVKCTLVPVDKNGKKVENVTLSQKKATVSSILYYTKDVPLDVPVEGGSDERYERTVKAPETITIKGDSAVLEGIDSISAEQIDISNVVENEKIKINPILPEGVTLAKESEDCYLSVKVKSLMSEKEVTLLPENIGISGVGDGLQAEVVSDNITVTLTGPSESLDQAEADSVSASCDVSGLAEGTHKVNLKVSSTAKNVQIADHTGKIEVKITSAQEEKHATPE